MNTVTVRGLIKAGVLANACFFLIAMPFGQRGLAEVPAKTGIRNQGVWITCFSKKEILYSKPAIIELMTFCRERGINELYLQLYRGGVAYYDSKILGRAKYRDMAKRAGGDPIDFLLKEAQKNNVKVFAWVNLLSLAANKNPDIVAQYGPGVFTRDQHGRTSLAGSEKNLLDTYYMRETQLYLEPGDLRVQGYLVSVVDEITGRYPRLAGIHLDYVRYPMAIPYLPDSRFSKYGLCYGFGQKSVDRFTAQTSIDPLAMNDIDAKTLVWDNWKRDQVTSLVKKISKNVKTNFPHMIVSAAVQPSPERAYSIGFQDWPLWLEKGFIDYVVLMSYTIDSRLFKRELTSSVAFRGKGKVYAGIGVFVLKHDGEIIEEQKHICREAKVDGVVYFGYDDLVSLPDSVTQ
ncbi:MAG: family 10 glycosylhydrolase [Candidatus Omnitrophica bacterium]|nr:family 10 glycosylhydrolase [Candidatus Omnitrophota bacterium]